MIYSLGTSQEEVKKMQYLNKKITCSSCIPVQYLIESVAIYLAFFTDIPRRR